MLSCGIIGLPNVGKSTLFNALTADKVAASNFPFCTIEPNTGVARVADQRLDAIAGIAGSAVRVPAAVHFVDVAGLVRGASRGEGLGNQFLGHIRDTAAIVHVVRSFDDAEVTHVDGRVDPAGDLETVRLELVLADLEVLERALAARKRKALSGDTDSKREYDRLLQLRPPLEAGQALRGAGLEPAMLQEADRMGLITAKPMLYLVNVSEQAAAADCPPEAEPVRQAAERDGAGFLTCCNALEAELAQLDPPDRQEMLEGLGLTEPALERLTRAVYRMLGLATFFTAGEKEARAWTMKQGAKALQAAGIVHSDMERGFIRAEIIACADYLKHGGEPGARRAGCLRLEGRDYQMQDGDIAHFRFNV